VNKTIDTLLLDLGGVLIDVDYHRTARAFHVLGFDDFEGQFSKAKQTPLFDRFEMGAISPAEFRDGVRALFRPDLTDREIDACWNAMLGSIPPARIELLKALGERYRLLLLSNTNAIHVPAFHAIIAQENGIPDFKELFEGAYYSCAIGLRKPDVEAFHFALAKHGASPERTLFIDDSIQHVVGARTAGLRAEHLELAHEDVLGMVERLGLLA
jgi:putative hydrolase of the HAD superfamily